MKFQLLDVTNEKSVTVTEQFPLAETELSQVDAYWRAANYLSVGQTT